MYKQDLALNNLHKTQPTNSHMIYSAIFFYQLFKVTLANKKFKTS